MKKPDLTSWRMRGHLERRWDPWTSQPATCQNVSEADPESPAPAEPPADHVDQPNLPEKNCPADPQETEK